MPAAVGHDRGDQREDVARGDVARVDQRGEVVEGADALGRRDQVRLVVEKASRVAATVSPARWILLERGR
jgi:hypothetical protein